MLIEAFRSVTNRIMSDDIKTIMQGIPATKQGTVKSWFADKKDKSLLTLSVDVTPEGNVINAWMPPARNVDEIKATYALIGGSRIDLKGKVLACNQNYIIFTTDWGVNQKVFGYRVF